MHFHIITLFPESFDSFLKTSIIWKAFSKWLFHATFYDLKWQAGVFEKVDDKAYGMHGQVMRVDVLWKKIEQIQATIWKKIPLVYFSPRWEKLTQKHLERDFETTQEYILLCGHYEGIDERVVSLYVDKLYSVWDYVLSGWELPAQIYMDALLRLIPWVLGNTKSMEEESFSQKLSWKKEYPLYTRPDVYKWLSVPSVLLSGNHKEIEKWKQENLI